MKSYYEILGVKENSSLIEIKRAFRQKAKELHPDIKNSIKRNSEDAMRILLSAYKILSDPDKRREYDRLLYHLRPSSFNYREFLVNRKEDLQSQSKLVFYDLLHDNPEEALFVYEFLVSSTDYNMEKYLDYGDFLECIFLLAEEFEKRSKYHKAFEFLKMIYLFEQKRPFFKYYIMEIIDRLRNLVCIKITKYLPPILSIGYIKELIELNLSKKDNAVLYKKLAELYLVIGNKDYAVKYLQKGLELNKRLAGVKKLKEKIGYHENINN